MARRRVVAGNWKLNKTIPETRKLIKEIRNKVAGMTARADLIVCPPFVSLEAAVDAARGSTLRIGAQNVFWEEKGAFTGEVSAEMLRSVGVEYVIVGHSERRNVFGESDEDVRRKVLKAAAAGLSPIMCVGELLDEREKGATQAVVTRQMRIGLASLAQDQIQRILVAYEPVWAIGTGSAASPGAANDVHLLIRRLLADMFGGNIAEQVRVLYGGSVKPDNAESFWAESEIDGVLVGGASLDAAAFTGILRSAG